jgi:hypothetical protein
MAAESTFGLNDLVFLRPPGAGSNEDHERTHLQSVDYAAFFDALDNPPAPNEKLRSIFERHRKTILSR